MCISATHFYWVFVHNSYWPPLFFFFVLVKCSSNNLFFFFFIVLYPFFFRHSICESGRMSEKINKWRIKFCIGSQERYDIKNCFSQRFVCFFFCYYFQRIFLAKYLFWHCCCCCRCRSLFNCANCSEHRLFLLFSLSSLHLAALFPYCSFFHSDVLCSKFSAVLC